MRKTTLIILDGFGINTVSPEKNAILQANAPTFQKLFSEPHSEL